MSEILQDLSVPALITAIEANCCERFRLFRYWSQAEVHDEPEMLWVISDIPFPLFNSVLRARVEPDGVDVAIEGAIARCASRNVPMLWWTGPSTRPTDLGKHLEAHGFTREEDAPGMAVGLLAMNEETEAPPGLVIEKVGDVETLKKWYQVFKGFFGFPDYVENAWVDSFASVGLSGRPPLCCYIGRLSGEPVATSFLVLGAGVAGIYGVGTVPDARRKGIGTAMTLAPLREARELGYRVGVLRSSEMGYGVYHKMGFRKYCEMGLYMWGTT
jgi:GNAT superfamily N-acetyltransferase